MSLHVQVWSVVTSLVSAILGEHDSVSNMSTTVVLSEEILELIFAHLQPVRIPHFRMAE